MTSVGGPSSTKPGAKIASDGIAGAADVAAATGGRDDWTTRPERGNLLALRTIAWIALTCGRRLSGWLLYPISLYFVVRAPEARRQAKRYLTRALSRPADWRDVLRLFRTFAITILDRVYFLRGGHAGRFDFKVTGATALHANLRSGRGAFVLGAHIGSFEAIGMTGRNQQHVPDLKIAMLMFPDNARQVNAVLNALAPAAERPEIIALGRPASMLALRDWLDSGGLAGMLADRTLPGHENASDRNGRSLSLPFLGAPAIFNDGPFRLAALLRRPVFFVVGLYDRDARYDVRFDLMADFSVPAATLALREQAIREAIEAYAARLESLCREFPYNWFNFHDFWREDSV